MEDARAQPLLSVLAYAIKKKPGVVVLEQVPGILRPRHREVFRGILKVLREHYVVSWKAPASALVVWVRKAILI